MPACSRLITVLLAALLPLGMSSGISAQEIHSDLCLHGCPLGGGPSDDLIIRDIYVLRSNDLTKLADWVSYRVTAETVGPSPNRNWRQDPLLKDYETLAPDDYRDANRVLGTDRGHQAPLASLVGTSDSQQTNYLSNITPQQGSLNQGPWARLEAAVRDLLQAAETDTVYVMTGPLFERPIRSLPSALRPHLIPSGYWKVIAVGAGGAIRASSFIMEQETPRGDNFCDHQVELEEAERRSRFQFFHNFSGALDTLDSQLGCG